MPPVILRSALVAFPLASLCAAPVPDWHSAQAVLSENCFDCHNAKKTKGGVDLKTLEVDPAVEANFALWEKVQEVLAKGTMPPEDETQLTKDEKQALGGWLNHELDFVANANAGDPGPVTLRRLSNAEYDYTIRDLTGIDYGLAKEFLPDGGGGEGFSNIGDVLFTNPQQLDKYLAAARKLAEYATILPGTGIVFRAQRIGLRGPEQMKAQAEQALYVWLQHKAEPYLPKDGEDFREADYMLACWKWRFKEQTGATSLDQLARDAGLKPAFLQNWWSLVNGTEPKSRFLDLTRVAWRDLPGPDAAKPKDVPPPVTAALQDIQAQRRSWLVKSVQRRQQDADGIRSDTRVSQTIQGEKVVHLCIGDTGDGGKGDIALISDLKVRTAKGPADYVDWLKTQPQAAALLARFGHHPQGRPVDPKTLVVAAPEALTLPVPEGAKEITASIRLDMKNPEVDFATIQWRFAVGQPPDVTKIMPGVLTIWKRQTKAASATMADFTVMKSAFPDVFERRLEQVAQNMYRSGPGPGVYYLSNEQIAALLNPAEKRELDAMRTDWGHVAPKNLDPKLAASWDSLVDGHLKSFATRAWRRPLTKGEQDQLAALYKDGVTKGLDRETAAREVVSRVLVSPNFLFKTEFSPVVAAQPPETSATDHPVSAWELASRLSYFLWSSLPDETLRRAAADGSLLQPAVRDAQVRRMLRDPKAQAMAKEFMGQWLEFNGFEKHSAVDAKKFPEFTPDLRDDMYQESVAFFTHFVREDRPVREIISADYTFLDERLAKFYGVPGVSGQAFRKVSVGAEHRGGLLGMGSILTKTSRSHRTSPVLRGNWLLQSVLGTPVPTPPANVPKLQEHGPKPATVREMLEQHRADKACASCHDRIDPLGFALENFDPIGRFRDKDEAGLPLDASGQVKSGATFTGIEGLRDYLKSQEAQFTSQFARKLLGYSLGRQVLPTDKKLLASISQQVRTGDGNFSTAVLAIVNSRQFLNRRY